jgi:ribonuclease P protein component
VETLKRWSEFQAVMANGHVVKTNHFALHHCRAVASLSTRPGFEETPALLFVDAQRRFGTLIPKRWAKKAVTRNLIRRQIREVLHSQSSLPVATYVVRLKASFDRRQYESASSVALKQAVRAELQQLLGKLRVTA